IGIVQNRESIVGHMDDPSIDLTAAPYIDEVCYPGHSVDIQPFVAFNNVTTENISEYCTNWPGANANSYVAGYDATAAGTPAPASSRSKTAIGSDVMFVNYTEPYGTVADTSEIESDVGFIAGPGYNYQFLVTGNLRGEIFWDENNDNDIDDNIPNGYDADAEIHRLEHSQWRVISNADMNFWDGISGSDPGMYVNRFMGETSYSTYPQTLIYLVEDMQLQFGIDTNGDAFPDRYVDPEDALLNSDPEVYTVKVWLRLRSRDRLDVVETPTFSYADTSYTHPGDGYIRKVFKRTFVVRNAQGRSVL
ncbi:MAG: hypothetical protein HKM24_00805, partial [Gammaproteobacteria bacterium]|nr:hypothetical protein [Gammaproteobacteria bacterium]